MPTSIEHGSWFRNGSLRKVLDFPTSLSGDKKISSFRSSSILKDYSLTMFRSIEFFSWSFFRSSFWKDFPARSFVTLRLDTLAEHHQRITAWTQAQRRAELEGTAAMDRYTTALAIVQSERSNEGLSDLPTELAGLSHISGTDRCKYPGADASDVPWRESLPTVTPRLQTGHRQMLRRRRRGTASSFAQSHRR
jgi:hypothetical protein